MYRKTEVLQRQVFRNIHQMLVFWMVSIQTSISDLKKRKKKEHNLFIKCQALSFLKVFQLDHHGGLVVRLATPCTRGYWFNTQSQQSFFFNKEKKLIYLLKLRKLSWCLLVINKNNSRSLQVTHLSLRTTFAELPIGKFSSYTLVSL